MTSFRVFTIIDVPWCTKFLEIISAMQEECLENNFQIMARKVDVSWDLSIGGDVVVRFTRLAIACRCDVWYREEQLPDIRFPGCHGKVEDHSSKSWPSIVVDNKNNKWCVLVWSLKCLLITVCRVGMTRWHAQYSHHLSPQAASPHHYSTLKMVHI